MQKNPFFFRVIPLEAPFCDREEELDRLVSCALSNTNVVLYSPRRYGKTSLVSRVQYQLEKKGIETIYIDISDCSSCDDISEKIAISIYSSAKKKESLLRKITNALKGWRPVFSPDPTGGVSLSVQLASGKRGLELLKETMESFNRIMKDDDRQFNIVIDEFQEITGIKDGDKIESLLRKYIQQQGKVSYFFLGSRRRLLVDMFNLKDRPFYKSSINFELPPLPKEKAIEFIIMRFKDGDKECPYEIAERIADKTKCYPYYIQRLPFAIYEVSADEDITDLDFMAGLEKMLIEEGVIFSSIEKSLPSRQKGLLKALASEPTGKPYAVSYIGKHRLGSLSSIQNAVKRLESLDYIEKDKDGVYQITDPMFALWLESIRETPYSADSAVIETKDAPVTQSLKQQNVQSAFQRSTAEINGYKTEEFADIKGVLPEEPSDKPIVNIFLSYAHTDKPLKSSFYDLIRNRLKTSSDYNFHFDVDTDVILIGENWHEEIQKMVRECDFGLLLLSTNFLSSEYITSHELPKLLNKCLPVALDILNFKRQDLKGLAEKQIYQYEEKAFRELGGPNLTRFVNELAMQIEDRVSKSMKSSSAEDRLAHLPICEEAGISEPIQCRALGERLLEPYGDLYISPRYIHPRGLRGKIEHKPHLEAGDTINVLDYLYGWAINPDIPFFALLGDYGAGKTFTCRMLTRKINELHNQNPEDYPLCIYIDLRFISNRKRDDRPPGLVEMLNEAIEKTKDPLDKSFANADDVIKLVRQNRAMIIYDGLDEKTVHFTPEETNEFVRQLLSIRETGEFAGQQRQGKILMSCRTHYFRDELEQSSLFLGRDREGRETKEYLSCTILPFDDKQIREYFKKRLGCEDEELDRLIDILNSVHNLKELAERPYTLSLISEFIPDIEKMGAGSRIINTAGLYDLMIKNWLNRDTGKHEFGVEHKKALMEALALELHLRAERSLPTQELEAWLDEWLYQNPAVQSAYSNINRETLKKDLRTATFIIREQESDFRFAHTSLQEYFLAGHIIKELSNRTFNVKRLAMPLPSHETLDFAAGIIESDKKKATACLKNISLIFEAGYEKQASELCLSLWQSLHDRKMETPKSTAIHLEGADLSAWEIHGLDLSKTVFDNADMKDTRFRDSQLFAASFKSTNLRNAEFLNCRMSGSDFTGSSAQGSVWKDDDLTHTKWEAAVTYLSDFVGCDLTGSSDLKAGEDTDIFLCKGIEATQMPGSYHLGIFSGHSSLVFSCAVIADNKRIVSASLDNTLRIWDIETGQCLKTLEGHSSAVWSCAVTADNKRIISASGDNTLRIWDIETGLCLKTLEDHSSAVMSCAVTADNKRIISASADNTLKIWDIETGQCLKTLKGHLSSVRSCAVTADDKRIVSASADNTLKIWDIETGICLKTLEGHSSFVLSCAVTADNKRIVSASADNTLKIWDIETGQCLKTLKGHSSAVGSCAVTGDNKRIISGSDDKTLKIWDIETGICLKTLEGHSASVSSCALTHDDKRIISASLDNTLKIWDIETGQCLKTLKGHSSAVWSCAVTADDKRIVSASADKTLKIWDIETGICLKTLEGHSSFVLSCAVTADNKRIVSASWDKTLKIWDIETGQYLKTLKGHSDSVRSCALTHDDKRIISASSDNTLKIWDSETGQCLKTLEGHSSDVSSCALTHDDKRIISASSDNTLKIWDSETGQCLKTLKGHSSDVSSCALTHDDKRIISASSDNTLKIWDSETGQCLKTLEDHSASVWSCALTHDDKRIISASADNTLKIWDLDTGQCLKTLEGHSDSVSSCALTHDDKRIISASADNTLKIWDCETGQCLKTLVNLPEFETAAWDGSRKSLLHASLSAWRWIGLSAGLKRFPIEALKSM